MKGPVTVFVMLVFDGISDLTSSVLSLMVFLVLSADFFAFLVALSTTLVAVSTTGTFFSSFSSSSSESSEEDEEEDDELSLPSESESDSELDEEEDEEEEEEEAAGAAACTTAFTAFLGVEAISAIGGGTAANLPELEKYN